MAEEQAHLEAGHVDGGVEEVEGVPPQILATQACRAQGVARRQARVRENLHLLPKTRRQPILDSFKANGGQPDARARHRDEDPDTASIPTQRGY